MIKSIALGGLLLSGAGIIRYVQNQSINETDSQKIQQKALSSFSECNSLITNSRPDFSKTPSWLSDRWLPHRVGSTKRWSLIEESCEKHGITALKALEHFANVSQKARFTTNIVCFTVAVSILIVFRNFGFFPFLGPREL